MDPPSKYNHNQLLNSEFKAKLRLICSVTNVNTEIGLEKCSMTWKNFIITKTFWHILIEPSKLDRIMTEQFKGILWLNSLRVQLTPKNQFFIQTKIYIILIYSSSRRSIFKKPNIRWNKNMKFLFYIYFVFTDNTVIRKYSQSNNFSGAIYTDAKGVPVKRSSQ